MSELCSQSRQDRENGSPGLSWLDIVGASWRKRRVGCIWKGERTWAGEGAAEVLGWPPGGAQHHWAEFPRPPGCPGRLDRDLWTQVVGAVGLVYCRFLYKKCEWDQVVLGGASESDRGGPGAAAQCGRCACRRFCCPVAPAGRWGDLLTRTVACPRSEGALVPGPRLTPGLNP